MKKNKPQGRATARPKSKNQTLPVEDKKSTSTSTPTAEDLTREFLKTPAMIEHARMLDQVQTSRDTGKQTVTVTVSNPFAAMLEFVERNNAAAAGRVPDPLAAIVQQIVDNELADMLHWLVVSPGSFPRYRDLWNSFCENRGAPQHKIGAEEPAPEGPF